jgi:hypothetical protein
MSDPNGDGVVAEGRVFAENDFAACFAGVEVKLQKRRDGKWRPRGSDRTGEGGRFRSVLPQGEGRYRAVAVAFDFEIEETPHRCARASATDRLGR